MRPAYKNEGIRVEETHTCLLDSTGGAILYEDLRDRLFDAPGTWGSLRCSDCGLVWLNPRPIAGDIPRLYEHYYTHIPADDTSWLAHAKGALRDAILVSHFGYPDLASGELRKGVGKLLGMVGPIRERAELSVMTLRAVPKGRLLDVGCGNGQFLAKMRALGWDVVGVETDPKAVSVAREEYGLEVNQGTVEEAGFPTESFDAVTMNHVIEHLPDPVNTLRECRRLLKPAGRLVVITPNIRSLGSRLFGRAWRGLEPPRHLFLFSSSALKLTAERAGIEILDLHTTARTALRIWTASRYIQRHGRAPRHMTPFPDQSFQVRFEGMVLWAVEYLLSTVGDLGEELVLIASR